MMAVSDSKVVEHQKTCPSHGEYTVKLLQGQSMGRPIGNTRCPVCEAQRESAVQAERDRMRQAQIIAQREARHLQSRIPLRFKARRFDNYVVETDAQRKALATCQRYATNWDQVSKDGTGLIFSGKAGAGKTHLACAIAFEVIERGGAAQFATVAEVMRQIKSAFAKDSTTTEQDQIDHFSSIQLLILDEVGMDYGTDFNKSLIFEILNNRYENMLPTILLTNLDAAVLREYLGERLIDRMREGGGKMVLFTWDSYRGKRAESAQ